MAIGRNISTTAFLLSLQADGNAAEDMITTLIGLQRTLQARGCGLTDKIVTVI
jgi:hypothetical protein